MYYVYVLKSESNRHYVGYTADLKSRVRAHNAGENTSTKGSNWMLIYYEAYASEKLARQREQVLKNHG